MTSLILIALEGKHENYLNGLYLGSSALPERIPYAVIRKVIPYLKIGGGYAMINFIHTLIKSEESKVSYIEANHPRHGDIHYGIIDLEEHFGIAIRFMVLKKKRFTFYMDKFIILK